MNKSKKMLIGIGIVTLIGIITIGIYNNQQTSGDDTIRIGVILPLTGSIAVDGEELLVGVRLAQQDVNASSVKKVVLEVEDGQFDPKVSVSAYNKLNAKGIDALIVAGDGPCEAIAPLINRDKKITMAPLTGSLKIKDCSPWMFRCWFYVPYVAQRAASFMKRSVGGDNQNQLSVFYNDTLYGNLSAKSFQNEVSSFGGKCVMESYPFMATTLRNEVAKLLLRNPTGIFITGFGLGFITAVNQVKESGYRGMLITDNALADVMVLNGLKNSKNIYFVDLDFLELIGNNESRMNDLSQKYSEMTGKSKISNQAILAYEATMALATNFSKDVEIMKQSIINRDPIARSLQDNITFTHDGEVVLPLVIKKYRSDGTSEVVDK